MDDARWNRLAAAAGILGLVLLIVGFAAAGSLPKADDTGAQLSKFFVDKRGGLLFSAFMLSLATPLLLWFFGSLRGLLAQVEGGRGALATTFIVGLVLLLTLFSVGTLVLTTLAWRGPAGLSDAELRFLYGAVVVASTSATAMASAVSVGAPSLLIWRTGVLPKWIAGIGVLVILANIAELVGVFSRTGGNAGGSGAGMAAVPLWIIFFLATSITVLRRDAAVVVSAAA
jgi:hypothetical protein